jgi:thiol-disulfide isomerase/thioredoxin
MRLPAALLILSLVVLSLPSLSGCGRAGRRPDGTGGLPAGELAPTLYAVGWINGEPLPEAERAGKVTVLIAWAYWCGPCFDEAPALVAAYDRSKDRGVQFVGLTSEGSDALDKSKEFLKAAGITWPNGYGALEPLRALRAEAIPAVWVVNKQGRIIWTFDSPGDYVDAIEQALAAPDTETPPETVAAPADAAAPTASK